jgi:hypothetical protein
VNPRKHLILLSQAVGAWAIFWLAGLPSYYQQYSPVMLAVACIFLTVVISLAAVFVLGRTKPEHRLTRAFWLCFYYTVPLAAFDALYCGVYLGHGVSFLYKYWYLLVFYVSLWFTFIPTAILLRGEVAKLRSRGS